MEFDSQKYYQLLLLPFVENADANIAASMSKYMRNQFAFFGIKAPLRRSLQQEFLKKHGYPPISRLPEVLDLMWQNEHREIQLFAVDLIGKVIRKVEKGFIAVLEKLITTKSWWDTVDLLAAQHAGFLLKKFPELVPAVPDRWVASDNIWLQRAALLFQLKYKTHTNQQLLFGYILQLNDAQEFFIQKGAGWALREYSKTNKSAVLHFINNHQLAPLTKREGLKWLKNRNLA